MKKYKKIITGLILALICAILPFVGVAKVKALTVNDLTTFDDLQNTIWIKKQNIIQPQEKFNILLYSPNIMGMYYIQETDTTYLIENYGNQSAINLYSQYGSIAPLQYYYVAVRGTTVFDEENNSNSGLIMFETWEENTITCNVEFDVFINKLQLFFDLFAEPEPTPRTIPFKIGVILGNSGTDQTDEIYLPFNDDTVSFSVDFTPTKLINGQISKAPGEDMRELIFQNGEKIFYTVYYNEDNVDFKLNFYGEELRVFLAVMHNTINQDNEGNYLPASQTYTSGLTSIDIDNLNNTGVYSASFEIQIPPEEELVSGHFLELRIGINPYVNDEENNENISNIMTGIFTLVSSFLSIQLGFITLGQIIGLVLAIGVIFFIFYVWNGGRNGN